MRMSTKTKLLLSAVSAVSIAATSTPSFAQSTDEGDVIITTGTRIQNPNVVSSSPVLTVDAELFDVRGTTDTIDLLNTLPSVFASQTTAFANGATGTSTVNLRGLGAVRTLVLVDGKRLPPGGPLAGNASDINLVAPQLVERVDVVTGGASAVYGSDAIAGVVNFITRKDFEGIELDLQYGFNQSNNNSGIFEDALTAIGEDTVQGSTTDNETFQANILVGASLDEGRGNVTGYFNYATNDGIQQGDRDFSRCATLNTGDDGLFCLGSGQGPFPTVFVLNAERQLDADGNPVNIAVFDADGNPLDSTGTGLTGDATQFEFPVNVPLVGFLQNNADRQLTLGESDVLAFDAEGNPILNPDVSGSGGLQIGDDSIGPAGNNTFNFNPFNPIRRATERFNTGFSGYYDITEKATGYLDVGYTSSSSPQVIAPSAAFGSAVNSVGCENPVLTEETRLLICGEQDADGNFARDTDGDGFAQAEVRRRFVEGGPRTDDRQRSNLRIVGGLRGTVDDENLNYDIFGQYSETRLQRIQTNQVTLEAITNSLDIVTDPATGLPACRVTVEDGANCVPFTSAFQNALPSAAEIASFIDTPTLTVGTSRQSIFGATLGGDLGKYGFKSPYAEEAISLLVGVEYRQDELIEQADGIAASGNLVGAGGATVPANGETAVVEGFAELQVPVVSGLPFVEQFNLTGALRFSDYSSKNNIDGTNGDNFDATTYAIGAAWQPTDDLRIRGQFQRAIRAPNVLNLFSPQNSGLTNLNDPCSGSIGSDNLTATAAECANTGLDPSLFGLVPADSGQLNTLTGGNPNLTPETADTYTIGAIYTPNFVPGLTLSVDYYDISVEDAIGTIPTSTTLQQCLDTGAAAFCDLIQRAPNGSLTAFPRELAFIAATNANIAEFATSGIDFQAQYTADLGDWGDLSFNYNSTYLISLESTTLPGTPSFDCAGFFNAACGNPNPEYRHNLVASWQTPWNVRTTGVWRYSSSTDQVDSIDNGFGGTGDITTLIEAGGAAIDDQIEAVSYFDVAAFWDVSDEVTLRVGSNNVFDNDPPIVTTFGTTGVNVEANTVAGVFDAGGRFIFAGANFKF